MSRLLRPMAKTYDATALDNAQGTIVAVIPVHKLANRWHQAVALLFPADMEFYTVSTWNKHHWQFTVNSSTGELTVHSGKPTIERGGGFASSPRLMHYVCGESVVFILYAGTVRYNHPAPIATRCHLRIEPI